MQLSGGLLDQSVKALLSVSGTVKKETEKQKCKVTSPFVPYVGLQYSEAEQNTTIAL